MSRCAFIISIAGWLLLLQGCSGETVKRTSFETLQNMREQQCSKDLSGNCPGRESYDDYQHKKKEALAPENRDKTAPPSLNGP
jgi:hypothetical protein